MIYLKKANEDLISHCKCSDGYISAPGQMDCPWCGCGWLFGCSQCRRAFTFAEAVEVDFSLEEMARRDLLTWRGGTAPPSEGELKRWVKYMTMFLREAELGRRYVYLDTYIIPVDAAGVKIEGVHSAHNLPVVPQVEALRDPSIIRDLLENPHYWRDTALPAKKARPST